MSSQGAPVRQAEDTAGAILEAWDLVKHYRLRGRRQPGGRPAPVVRAVDGVSLAIGRRAAFGLVGDSG